MVLGFLRAAVSELGKTIDSISIEYLAPVEIIAQKREI